MPPSPQYYNELVCDPHDVDTVYSVDTLLQVTEGRWRDLHAGRREARSTWTITPCGSIPMDPDYMLVGCDGGVYESFDRGANWLFKENLPITQFYRVSVDTSKPFYYVYGGTQDNNTLGGPSRTLRQSGISNEDWFITVGGDGYETQVDPTDPNIVYSQWQYGGLVRYDRRSGEIVDIQPQEEPGEDAHRWNWDSPLIISPHSPTRLYYAASGSSAPTTGATPGPRSPAISAGSSTATSCRSWGGSGRWTRSPRTNPPRTTATSCR